MAASLRKRPDRPPTTTEFNEWLVKQINIRRGDLEEALSGREQVVWEFLQHFEKYVLYEDPHLLIINKPAGINSHFSDITPVGVQEITRHIRPGFSSLAHRLDRDTSGVLLIARNREALTKLYEQFANKTESQMQKIYLSLVEGVFTPENEVAVTVPVMPRGDGNMRIVEQDELTNDNIISQSKDTKTIFKPLAVLRADSGSLKTLVEVQILTGRTHQTELMKNKEEFLDHNHKAMDTYYAIMEKNVSPKKLKRALEQLIEVYPDFYDPYIQLAYLLQEEEEYDQASKLLKTAYQRAIKRIIDKDGNFPKSLPWLWLENRHIIRSIDAYATDLWEEEKTQEALGIFRILLRSDINDNVGARYSILAIRLGLKPDYEMQFEMDNMPAYMDANQVMDWFEKESKKIPDEFDWWNKAIQRQEEIR